MKLIKKGKTKDVFELENGNFKLAFTGRVTKNDAGEIDPGGNNVSDELVPGKAAACYRMTMGIFLDLEHKYGVDTHLIEGDPNDLSITVKRGKLYRPGLEFIGRWWCTGSLYRRFKSIPGVKDGVRLPVPIYEITLKDDAAGDPLLNKTIMLSLGIVDTHDELDCLKTTSRNILSNLFEMFASRGLDLWDAKIELCLDGTGSPVLIDEISPDACRAYKKGTKERVTGQELADHFYPYLG